MLAGSHAKPIQDLARELDRLGSSGDPGRRIAAHGPEANAIARSVERMVSNLKFREQHEMEDLAEVVSRRSRRWRPRSTTASCRRTRRGSRAGRSRPSSSRASRSAATTSTTSASTTSHLGVIMLDTSVRGIPAAVVMRMARAYVRADAPGVLSPADVLMKVNRLLAADLSQGQYVTALYAVIDTGNGTAKIASAGHLPLVIYRHGIGKTAIVNPEGIALGLDVGPVFDRSINEVEVEIGPGDRLVLHTDGALKVQNETGDEFGEQRLYAVIKQKAPMNSQAFVNFVGSTIDQFHLTTPQNDDITISTVKRLKCRPRATTLAIPPSRGRSRRPSSSATAAAASTGTFLWFAEEVGRARARPQEAASARTSSRSSATCSPGSPPSPRSPGSTSPRRRRLRRGCPTCHASPAPAPSVRSRLATRAADWHPAASWRGSGGPRGRGQGGARRSARSE